MAYPKGTDVMRVFGEVAFNLPSRVPLEWGASGNYSEEDFHNRDSDEKTLIVSGRVDFVIGRVLGERDTKPKKDSIRNRIFLFESYLVVVQADIEGRVEKQLTDVVAFLASVHQSRKAKNRGSSVYGIATDGRTFIFVSISHDGHVLQSAPLSMKDKEQAGVILKSIKYFVEKSRAESMRVATNEGQAEKIRLLDDKQFDVDIVEDKKDDDEDMDEGEGEH